MMLAPFLLALSFFVRAGEAGSGNSKARVTIPWFAFVFLLVVGWNSIAPLPAVLHDGATILDTWLLTMSMAALGLTTHLSAIRRAGLKPLLLAALLFAWLIVGGALVNRGIAALGI
jgi:uncharacterized integral membrane protein (TIGR00698 family)